MSNPAYVFLFTDWHLQKGNTGRRPEEWPPFSQRVPPDKRPILKMAEEINRRYGRIIASDFPPEKRMEITTSRIGVEAIESDAEPDWENVWGVIVDRGALSSASNSDKLRKMAIGLSETIGVRRGRLVGLFLTPRGDGSTPAPLSRYQRSFVINNVDTPDEFIIMAASMLAMATQEADAEVIKHIEKAY